MRALGWLPQWLYTRTKRKPLVKRKKSRRRIQITLVDYASSVHRPSSSMQDKLTEHFVTSDVSRKWDGPCIIPAYPATKVPRDRASSKSYFLGFQKHYGESLV